MDKDFKELKKMYSWDSITIKQYEEINDILQDDEMDTTSKTNELMAVIEGVESDTIWNMSITEWHKHSQYLSFLNDFKLKDFKSDKVKIGDMEFNISQDMNNICVAQWMDYQNLANEKTDIANLLSVFLVPIGKKYGEDYDVLELRKFIKENCNFFIAQGILSFIYTKYANSLKASLQYLVKIMRREKNKEKKAVIEKQYHIMVKQIKSLTNSIFCAQ